MSKIPCSSMSISSSSLHSRTAHSSNVSFFSSLPPGNSQRFAFLEVSDLRQIKISSFSFVIIAAATIKFCILKISFVFFFYFTIFRCLCQLQVSMQIYIFLIYSRMSAQHRVNSAISLLVSGNSKICSAPCLPITQGTPA